MESKPEYYRQTKIIITLGPSTESAEMLSSLIRAGVDVIRLNMAHASREWVLEVVARIRGVSQDVGRHVAVMMDIKGPEIRTEAIDQPIQLAVGSVLDFRAESSPPNPDGTCSVTVNYASLADELEVGQLVLVDSGLIRLQVLSKDATSIRCKVLTPGILGSRRHINLPGVHVNLPALTEKDLVDLQAGVETGIDFVALSFVRQASDVVSLKQLLQEMGSTARVISKIEEQAGVRNMKEIIRESDGIMVARGDLGIETEYHRLPLLQSELVHACQSEGKPVIIATHLLESMIDSPIPTRAEISDVSTAVREQADAVMLSGETTTGSYPLEAVEVLKNVIQSVEPTVDGQLNLGIKLREPKAKMLRSAATLAQELGDSGVVVFTRSGFLAYVLGALRPMGVPIYAFTDIEPVFRQLLLPWGVEPFLMDFSEDPEQTILDSLSYLKRRQWCKRGAWLTVITNALANDKIVDTMQLRQVE